MSVDGRFREEYLKDIRGDGALAGRRIILAVTGSIAAVECPRLARELMRRGADVRACMTASAAALVTPTAMEWCTGNPVVTRLTGQVEHLALAGEWGGAADLLLVAPATANTIGKMALGIDDTVVTTVATTAIGAGLPVVVAPGMHAVMHAHPAFQENLRRLEGFGVDVVAPEMAEGKAKMASVEAIVAAVAARLGPRPLAGRRVLITAGPTVAFLDAVRVVTNLSSGRMGVALAEVAARRGARVILIYGPGSVEPPPGVEVVRVLTTEEMLAAVRRALQAGDADVSILAAAVADYEPAAPEPGKVGTAAHERWSVELVKSPKILEAVRALTNGLVVAFKAEAVEDDAALLLAARDAMARSGADLTVANRVGPGRGFLEPCNEVYVLDARGTTVHVPMADKRAVAARIWDVVDERLAEGSESATPG